MTSAVTEIDVPTPVSDSVLGNPLAVPAGVAPWLRGWERRLRVALRDAEAHGGAVTSAGKVAAFEEALAELRALHPDDPAGLFRLLLKRPLWQLEEGSAARETFERYATTVFERVNAAVDLLGEIAPLEAQRAQLVAEFEERFPNRLAEQLAHARARDADIARLRRAADAVRMRGRLDRARIALEAIATAAPDSEADDTHGAVAEGETATLYELVAALAIERRARRHLEQHSGALRGHRAGLAAELRGLALAAERTGIASGQTRGRLGHAPAMLEHLIAACTEAEDSSRAGGDAPLWGGALAAAASAYHPQSARFAWLPAMAPRVTPPAEPPSGHAAEAQLLHVVPAGGDLVYLSPRAESVIRVRTRDVRLGATLECQVAPEMVARHPHLVVDRDVPALFDGLDAECSRWYSTTSRAQVRVIASGAGGWFARLERNGTVAVMDQPPWHSEGPGSAFRILRPFAATGSAPATPAGVTLHGDRVRPGFFGFTLRDVRTGLLGDERAWMRGATTVWPGSVDRVRAEHELFVRLERYAADRPGTVGGLALRPLGWASTGESSIAMPLYRIPLATLDAPSRLRQWIVERDENLLSVLSSVARVISAVHECGHGIGVCHTEAFAFGIEWAPDPLWPVPAAILAHAPCATLLGEPYTSPAVREMLPAHYTMLRTPVLVPQVAAGQIASRERDMVGFGAFLLDLLLDRPLVDRGALDWYDAGRVVRGAAVDASRHAELAVRIMGWIEDPLGWRKLLDVCERLARGEVRGVLGAG